MSNLFQMKHTACCTLLVYVWLVLFFPFYANAQGREGGAATACADAEQWVASADSHGLQWFGIGFLLGPIGVLLPLAVKDYAPQAALLGKSPEYVAAFGECYTKGRRNQRFNNAAAGCLTGVAVVGLIVWGDRLF